MKYLEANTIADISSMLCSVWVVNIFMTMTTAFFNYDWSIVALLH